MDFDLNEQEKMIQSAARGFAQKVVQPTAAEIDRTAQFPRGLAQEMGNMGYYGLPYPPQYGGTGAGYLAYALVVEQLSQASMAVGAIVAVSILSEECLFRFGNEQQKREFLAQLALGRMFGCFCFTEPATGSDPKAVNTRARPDGNDYVIEGEKTFIAVSPVASIGTVFAKDETERISAFVVPTTSPGFVLREPCDTMGL
ncbi:MAG: acyl-CoA dehydrogenase family protein, partial [Chloroflexi bacterium]|nr:acyl-CoA dehydrogenase family protein [Chloroflexota bacterium]